MAKEYASRRSSRARSSAPHQFLVVTVTFLLGYLTATVLDIETLSRWINTQVLAHQEMNRETPKAQTPPQAALPPKPKFEFYTLLANEKVPNSQAAPNTANTPTPAKASSPVTAATQAATVNTAAVNAVKANAPKAQQVGAVKTAETRAAIPVAARGTYLVQVASFKARQDAEHMKGNLILKGFNVNVVPINHASKGNWFRVMVGPYSNRALAQKAQMDLARRERLRGMITAG